MTYVDWPLAGERRPHRHEDEVPTQAEYDLEMAAWDAAHRPSPVESSAPVTPPTIAQHVARIVGLLEDIRYLPADGYSLLEASYIMADCQKARKALQSTHAIATAPNYGGRLL